MNRGSVVGIQWRVSNTQTLPYAKEFVWTFCTYRPPSGISTTNFFLFNTAVPNMYHIASSEVPEGASGGELEYSIHDISEELHNSTNTRGHSPSAVNQSAARDRSPIVRVGTSITKGDSTNQKGKESSTRGHSPVSTTRGHETKVSFCRYRM